MVSAQLSINLVFFTRGRIANIPCQLSRLRIYSDLVVKFTRVLF
jgi:hypothetical protein